MPLYDYVCPQNGRTVEVRHSLSETISTWGELCDRAGIEPEDTPTDTPVKRKITAPSVLVPTSDRELKDAGFTKLVKRDKGVYENVTGGEGEPRVIGDS